MKVLDQYYQKRDREAKELLEKVKTYPVAAQKIVYNIKSNSLMYEYIELAEDDEKYVVSKTQVKPRIASAGHIFTQRNNITGITIYKQGRKTQRIKVWFGKKPFETIDLAIKYFIHFNDYKSVNLINLFNHHALHMTLTKGLYSNILCGNFTEMDECMRYYAKYSLRDVKLNEDNMNSTLKNFIVKVGDWYKAVSLLRLAYFPNELLQAFKSNSLIDDKDLNMFYNNFDNSKIQELLTFNKKIYNSFNGTESPYALKFELNEIGFFNRYKVEKIMEWFDKGYKHTLGLKSEVYESDELLPF